MQSGPPEVLRYGVSADEAHRFGLPCGGTLELILEFDPCAAALVRLLDLLDGGSLVRRDVDLNNGAVSLTPTHRAQPFGFDGGHMLNTLGPGTLDAAQIQALEAQALALQQRKGSQLQVLMVATTQPETIEQYAQRVFDQWKLGRKGVDDGVLLLVAKEDRRVRIHPGSVGALRRPGDQCGIIALVRT